MGFSVFSIEVTIVWSVRDLDCLGVTGLGVALY